MSRNCLFLIALISINAQAQPEPRPDTPVIVTNPPEQPVPVEIDSVGPPTVNVGNTPTVNVGNTPSVTVGNAPDQPVPVSVEGPVSVTRDPFLPIVGQVRGTVNPEDISRECPWGGAICLEAGIDFSSLGVPPSALGETEMTMWALERVSFTAFDARPNNEWAVYLLWDNFQVPLIGGGTFLPRSDELLQNLVTISEEQVEILEEIEDIDIDPIDEFPDETPSDLICPPLDPTCLSQLEDPGRPRPDKRYFGSISPAGGAQMGSEELKLYVPIDITTPYLLIVTNPSQMESLPFPEIEVTLWGHAMIVPRPPEPPPPPCTPWPFCQF